MIAVFGEFHRVLTLDDLVITGVQALGELLDLVAGIVDIEFTPHIGTVPAEYLSQGVTQHAAAGVAHMHGAGGVGGNEFHHDPLPLQAVGLPVFPAQGCGGLGHLGKISTAQIEIQKAGTRHLCPFNFGAGRQVLHQHITDHLGCLAEDANVLHGKVAGKITVLRLTGLLNIEGKQLRLGQQSLGHASLIAFQKQLPDLLVHFIDRILHLRSFPSFQWSFHSY